MCALAHEHPMTQPRTTAVASRLLDVRGLRVRMRVVGDGEPVLLLNGLTRPLESWGPFTESLRGRTLISFDAPGVGGSPTPILPLSILALATLAAAVLDEAGVNRADVLGFSHGGAVAQQLAVDAPARVRGLVLVSTSCGIGATASRAVLKASRDRSDRDSWPQVDAVGALWHSLAISSWSSIPFLGAIRAPTLVVCGSRDRVVPPANSTLLARRIPAAELAMLTAGHDLQRRGPASALAARVAEFLSTERVLGALPVDRS
jgi:poly(3-hydroxyoctanoate) depolymerase